MMRLLASLAAGAVFGVGMALSGMTNPARVLGFFDVFGAWDPTLAFVMGGAMLPMIAAWRMRARMEVSALGAALPGPPSRHIDRRLIGGSVLFGFGWGIAGVCPGAVIPALAYGGWPVGVFAIALLIGMALHGRLTAKADAAIP
jgi:uncharacterized membrane protein YedE/YeeE